MHSERLANNGAPLSVAPLAPMTRSHLLLTALLLTSCGTVAESRNWEFVQSVGGIAVEQPTKSTDGWLLPVQADVSGLRAITVTPTLLNSALSCKSVRASIEGQVIYITVVTGVAGRDRTSICPPANLQEIRPGAYSVLYRGPNGKVVQLSKIVVGR